MACAPEKMCPPFFFPSGPAGICPGGAFFAFNTLNNIKHAYNFGFLHKIKSKNMVKVPKNKEIVVLCGSGVASFSKEMRFAFILYSTKEIRPVFFKNNCNHTEY